MVETNTLYLKCPKCDEVKGVCDVPKFTDTVTKIYLDFDVDIDALEVVELDALAKHLKTVEFICEHCENVFTYNDHYENNIKELNEMEMTPMEIAVAAKAEELKKAYSPFDDTAEEHESFAGL